MLIIYKFIEDIIVFLWTLYDVNFYFSKIKLAHLQEDRTDFVYFSILFQIL